MQLCFSPSRLGTSLCSILDNHTLSLLPALLQLFSVSGNSNRYRILPASSGLLNVFMQTVDSRSSSTMYLVLHKLLGGCRSILGLQSGWTRTTKRPTTSGSQCISPWRCTGYQWITCFATRLPGLVFDGVAAVSRSNAA